MNDAVIVDALRTPLGKRNGQFAGVHPVDLSARLIALLHALLAFEQAVLRLQHPPLCTLRPRAFRLLRLQLLHALLQAIDAGLAVRGLARQHLALPLLIHQLTLLDLLLMLLRAPIDLLPSRQPLAYGRCCAWISISKAQRDSWSPAVRWTTR